VDTSPEEMFPTTKDRFERKRWKVEVEGRIEEASKKSFDTWLLTVSSAAIGAFIVSPTFRADVGAADLKPLAAFSTGSLCVAIASCIGAKLCLNVIWHYRLMALRKDESDSWAAVAKEPSQVPKLPSAPEWVRGAAVLLLFLTFAAFLVGFLAFARVVILTLILTPGAKP